MPQLLVCQSDEQRGFVIFRGTEIIVQGMYNPYSFKTKSKLQVGIAYLSVIVESLEIHGFVFVAHFPMIRMKRVEIDLYGRSKRIVGIG